MKCLYTCAPALVLAELAMPLGADDSASFSITDDTVIQPISLKFVGDDSAQKDDSCQKDSCDGKGGKGGCSCYLFGPDEAFALSSSDNCRGITFGGWTQIGYHTQQSNLSQAVNDGLAFNDHANRVNLHQQWLYIEKALSGDECRWDWGFRADFMYGTDWIKTSAFGGTNWDTTWDRGGGYGFALPQLYAELGKGAFSVKMGHFYGVSNNEMTFGVNYRPHANLVIRPEIRHDWNNIPAGVAGTVNRSVFGVDAILTY